ncbi:hypothetical protein [uncultured Campylobacter sp.]|nr:hypothetical protein [uncultured Campylobacter sp.]
MRYEIKMIDFIKFIFIRVYFDKKYADFKTLETRYSINIMKMI